MDAKEPRKRMSRVAVAASAFVMGAVLAGTSAAVAVSGGLGPADWLDLNSPNGTVQRMTVDDAGKLVVTAQTPTTPPTSPPVTSPPVTSPPVTSPPVTTPPTDTAWPARAFPTSGPNAGWLSGSSGENTANGNHGTWRGTKEDIATTWVTDANPDATLKPGAEFANWTGSLVVSLPLVSSPAGWAQCATGACDARWTTELRKIQTAWSANQNRTGILFYSPAWEFNGSWMAHRVDPNNPQAMATSLKRFREIQKSVSPNAKVMLTVNRDTSGLSVDWRRAVPGYSDAGGAAANVKKYLDVLGVDYYNSWASASQTQADWDRNALKLDGYGAPIGIERYRQTAESFGLPLGVPEWSGDANGQGSTGDAAIFPVAMHAFLAKNTGTGAGKTVLDVNFAVQSQNGGKFVYGPTTQMPKASAAYRENF